MKIRNVTFTQIKRFVLAAGALAVASCAAAPAFASTLDEVLAGSLKIYSGDRGDCSATLIADDLLLTAGHCVDQEEMNVRLQVLDKDFNVVQEQIVYVKVLRKLTDRDVAILAPIGDRSFTDIFGPSVSVVDVATPAEVNAILGVDKGLGTPIWAVGYPKGMELTLTNGMFAGTVKAPEGGIWKSPLYKITAPITGGNSGGGLFMQFCNETEHSDGPVTVCEYKLIGVNVAGFRDVSFMNYSVPIENIEAVTAGFIKAEIVDVIEKNPASEGTTDSK